MLAENKQRHLIVINSSGALVNILLNLWLIPELGIAGAAVASVVTQIFSNFILGVIYQPIRANNWLTLKSFDPRGMIDTIKIVLRRK